MNSAKQAAWILKNNRTPPTANIAADSTSTTVPVMNSPQWVENQLPKLSHPDPAPNPAIIRPNAPKP